VTSTIEEPVPGWIDNVNGVTGLALIAGLGILRSMHAKKNNRAQFVPVDYVANCILAAEWKAHRYGTTTIYNYTGHNKNMITWGTTLFELSKPTHNFFQGDSWKSWNRLIGSSRRKKSCGTCVSNLERMSSGTRFVYFSCTLWWRILSILSSSVWEKQLCNL
jgi:hypothetical protein